MAFPRQQNRRTIGSPHKGKKGPQSFKWLANTIYVVLAIMVLHLATSNGDPMPIKPTVHGKTTTKKSRLASNNLGSTGGYNTKKVPSYRQPEHFNTVSELTIADNVQALKASVDDVLVRLEKAAQIKVDSSMDDLRSVMEPYKSKIATMMSKVSKILFPGQEIGLQAEKLIYELFVDKVVTQYEEQVDLWILQTSDDMDAMVANYEEEGLDVNEIDDKLAAFESEKLPDLYEEIAKIAIDLQSQMPYTVPPVVKHAVEGILEHLGQHTTVRFDSYEVLEFEVPLPNGVSFTDKRLIAAIEDGRTTSTDDDLLGEDEDDNSDKDASKDADDGSEENGLGNEDSEDEAKEVDASNRKDSEDEDDDDDTEVAPDVGGLTGASNYTTPDDSEEDGEDDSEEDGEADSEDDGGGSKSTDVGASVDGTAGEADTDLSPDDDNDTNKSNPDTGAGEDNADDNDTENSPDDNRIEDKDRTNNSPDDGDGGMDASDDSEDDGRGVGARDADQDNNVSADE